MTDMAGVSVANMTAAFSFEAKLERAGQHLQSLEQEIKRWLSRNPYRFTDEVDPDTGYNVMRLKRVGRPPDAISLISGDCAHNLRSTLDHLIYRLAVVANNGREIADAIARQIAFPIFSSPGGFNTRGKPRIRLINPAAQTLVQGLQPYQTGNEFPSHWLWLVSEMDNIDKHRSLILTVTADSNLSVGAQPGMDVFIEELSRSASDIDDDYAEVVYYKAFLDSDRSKRVPMKFNFTSAVTFVDGAAKGREVFATLKGIRDYIAREVLPRFSALV